VSEAVERQISPDYLRFVVERLSSVGSSPLGFRVAGTPEERRAAAFVAREMRDAGLHEVVEEPVPVDAWRFREAFVEIGGRRYEGVSMGGAPRTSPRGVAGELVFVRRGGRRELAGVEVAGKVVLVDWSDGRLWPFHFGLELGLRGAAAVIVACFAGGPWYQADGALGTFDAMWHRQAPPLLVIRREDGERLAGLAPRRARVVVRASLRKAVAANVVGLLPGRRARAPLLVGGHHDGWFSAACDDATGVAVVLALARAFGEAGLRPQHPVAFISHTAEEYGIAWSRFDRCYGAWYQIGETRRPWASRAPFYLNVEGSGLPAPFEVDAPPELAGSVRRWLRRSARDGLLPHGFRVARPNPLTEVWTFLAAGVPAINVASFEESWYRSAYHTQYDTADRIDFAYLAKLTRALARFLLEVDAAPGAVLDYEARARDLRRALLRVPQGAPRARLERSLARLGRMRGRPAYTALGRGLHGLDAAGNAAYPHEQAAADLARLEAALGALRTGRRAAAARHAAAVGLNRLCQDLSAEAFALELDRSHGGAARACWARQGGLGRSANLWHELASLRGEPAARPFGPWVARSLERHRHRAGRELERRLERMAASVAGQRRPLPRPRRVDLP
jgi:Iap family predicted aminopeptidase